MWKALYRGRQVKELYRDDGREFLGEFGALMLDKEIAQRVSVPRRPQTNSRQEGWHRTLAEGARTALRQSELPGRLWSYALLHWNFNRNRQARKLPNGTVLATPFKSYYGHEHNEKVVPFGTGCIMLREDLAVSEKFAAKEALRVIIGYGPGGSYKVLDAERMKKTGKFAFVTTRDVKVLEGEYPAKKLNFDYNFEVSEKFSQHTIDRCPTCDKFLVSLDEVPRCKGCITGKGYHAKNATCKLQWCDCPQEEPKDPDDHEADGEPSSRLLLAPRQPELNLENAPEAPPEPTPR